MREDVNNNVVTPDYVFGKLFIIVQSGAAISFIHPLKTIKGYRDLNVTCNSVTKD